MDKFILFLIEHYFYSVPLLVVVILLIRSNAVKGGKKITPQDLVSLTNQEAAKLIDLRSPNEFARVETLHGRNNMSMVYHGVFFHIP